MSGKEPAESSLNHLYLGLGSNIHPESNISAALEYLSHYGTIISQSSIWKSPSRGSHGPDFLNSVVLIDTKYSSKEFKVEVIRKIEEELGRVRTQNVNAPRTIDIDIIISNGQIQDQEVWSAPHIAVPLSEIYPDLQYPISGKKISEVAEIFLKTEKITKIS